MVFFLNGQKLVQLADLCQAYRGMEFGNTIVIPDKGMQVCATVNAFMVVSMVGKTIAFGVDIFTVGDDAAAFRAGDRLDKIKGESAGMADRSKKLTLVFRAKALAGVFEQDQPMFFTD